MAICTGCDDNTVKELCGRGTAIDRATWARKIFHLTVLGNRAADGACHRFGMFVCAIIAYLTLTPAATAQVCPVDQFKFREVISVTDQFTSNGKKFTPKEIAQVVGRMICPSEYGHWSVFGFNSSISFVTDDGRHYIGYTAHEFVAEHPFPEFDKEVVIDLVHRGGQPNFYIVEIGQTEMDLIKITMDSIPDAYDAADALAGLLPWTGHWNTYCRCIGSSQFHVSMLDWPGPLSEELEHIKSRHMP